MLVSVSTCENEFGSGRTFNYLRKTSLSQRHPLCVSNSDSPSRLSVYFDRQVSLQISNIRSLLYHILNVSMRWMTMSIQWAGAYVICWTPLTAPGLSPDTDTNPSRVTWRLPLICFGKPDLTLVFKASWEAACTEGLLLRVLTRKYP